MYRVIFGSVLLASLVGVSQAGVDGVLSVDLARWALLNSEDPTTYPDGVQSKSSGVQLTGGVVHHNLDERAEGWMYRNQAYVTLGYFKEDGNDYANQSEGKSTNSLLGLKGWSGLAYRTYARNQQIDLHIDFGGNIRMLKHGKPQDEFGGEGDFYDETWVSMETRFGVGTVREFGDSDHQFHIEGGLVVPLITNVIVESSELKYDNNLKPDNQIGFYVNSEFRVLSKDQPVTIVVEFEQTSRNKSEAVESDDPAHGGKLLAYPGARQTRLSLGVKLPL